MTLAGTTVDPDDRPLLTGLGVKEISGCRGSAYGSHRINEGFAARLTTRGVPDPSFGESGVRAIGALRQVGEPLFDPKGDGVVFTGGILAGCGAESGPSAVAHLSHRGNLDRRFGPEGWTGFENTEGGFEANRGSPAAVDDQGRILLLRTDEDGLSAEMARLQPDGGFDGSFGHRGIARVPQVTIAHITTIAVDARSREVDSRFTGRNGLITSFPGFGAKTKAVAQQILLDRGGHILVGGSIASNRFSTGLGVGLIRYRARR